MKAQFFTLSVLMHAGEHAGHKLTIGGMGGDYAINSRLGDLERDIEVAQLVSYEVVGLDRQPAELQPSTVERLERLITAGLMSQLQRACTRAGCWLEVFEPSDPPAEDDLAFSVEFGNEYAGYLAFFGNESIRHALRDVEEYASLHSVDDTNDSILIDLRPVARYSGCVTGKLDTVDPVPGPARRRESCSLPYHCCDALKCRYCGQCHNPACQSRKVICAEAQRDLMYRELVPLDGPGHEQVEAIVYHNPEPQPQKWSWLKKWWR